MSQPEISPLARRLAEENNVDWRVLHGSGAGGKVVERDVLEFLARVMAGEEDVDPTPEPVPEGMEEWPEEDVRSFQQEVQASRKDAGLDEIQQELSAADRLGGGIGHEALSAESASEGMDVPDADEISEDIFLFGDDAGEADEGAPAAEEWERPPFRSAAAATDEPEDELLVAGDDDLTATDPVGLGPEPTGPEPTEPGEDVWDVGAADTGADEEPFDLGDHAAHDEVAGREPRSDLPDVFGAAGVEDDDWQSGAGEALFAEGSDGAGAPGHDEGVTMPSLGEVDEAAPQAGDGAGGWDDAWDVGAAEREQAPVEEGGALWGAGPAEPPAGEDVEEPSVSPGDAVVQEPHAEPALDERPEVAGGAFDDAPSTPAGTPLREGPPGGEPVVPSPRELPLVSYGTLLRRHLDVTALAGAQLAVGLELGESEPLPLAPFLLRAAAKAVAEAGWGDGSVAVVALESDGGVSVRRVDDAASRPFLELMQALAADAGAAGESAALCVVDMSALDVDEAVLNVGGPLLTLGRILYDNQRGSYRSTLSLAGEVPAERGAKLLARVAELLDAPVRLLL